MVLLNRCENDILQDLSPQQGGFQKQLGCLMTSFILRESLHFAREQSSRIYVCCLEGRQAFDHVWHNGLLLKLCELSIDQTTLMAIREMYRDVREMYRDVTCQVKVGGSRSEDVQILQGTKQGGKSSPAMYLLFINGLIRELEASNLGICLYGHNVCCPTLADDMTLVSFSKAGLDMMLNICWEYSCRWRYFYNASKCVVVVFNDTGDRQYQRTYSVGSETIKESDSLVHLGIGYDRTLSNQSVMYDASVSLRGMYMSIVHNGIKSKSVSPLLLKTLYLSAVLPKALYGCELWTVYNKRDLAQIETAHRYCVKHMQRLSKFCNTEFAYLMIDIPPLEMHIDKRKLLLFGQLCRLPCNYLAKITFVNRLVRYRQLDGQVYGFIPDIVRILHKYQLSYVLDIFLTNGTFPSKGSWKRTINCQIDHFWKPAAIKHLNLKLGALYRPVSTGEGASYLWRMARDNYEYRFIINRIVDAMGILTSGRDLWTCSICGVVCNNLVVHRMCHCSKNYRQMTALWDTILHFKGIEEFMRFMCLPSRDQCIFTLNVIIDMIKTSAAVSELSHIL